MLAEDEDADDEMEQMVRMKNEMNATKSAGNPKALDDNNNNVEGNAQEADKDDEEGGETEIRSGAAADDNNNNHIEADEDNKDSFEVIYRTLHHSHFIHGNLIVRDL